MAGERHAHDNRLGQGEGRFGEEREPRSRRCVQIRLQRRGRTQVRGGREVEEDEKDEVVGERAEEVVDAAFVTGGGKILG